jgi:hypothetical protein
VDNLSKAPQEAQSDGHMEGAIRKWLLGQDGKVMVIPPDSDIENVRRSKPIPWTHYMSTSHVSHSSLQSKPPFSSLQSRNSTALSHSRHFYHRTQ